MFCKQVRNVLTNLKPKPGPKPSPTWKARPDDLQLWSEQQAAQMCNFGRKHQRYLASTQYKIRKDKLGMG